MVNRGRRRVSESVVNRGRGRVVNRGRGRVSERVGE